MKMEVVMRLNFKKALKTTEELTNDFRLGQIKRLQHAHAVQN
jgi:hypothetical protein